MRAAISNVKGGTPRDPQAAGADDRRPRRSAAAPGPGFDPHLPAAVFDDPRIPKDVKHLLTGLGRYAGGDVAVSWPRVETLAAKLDWSLGHTYRIIRRAAALGLLAWVQGVRRKVFVHLYKLRGGLGTPPEPVALAPKPVAPAPKNFWRERQQEWNKGAIKKRTAGGGRATQGPPPPADPEKDRDVARAALVAERVAAEAEALPLPEELAGMAREIVTGGRLANFYRVALTRLGITEPEAIAALVETPSTLPAVDACQEEPANTSQEQVCDRQAGRFRPGTGGIEGDARPTRAVPGGPALHPERGMPTSHRHPRVRQVTDARRGFGAPRSGSILKLDGPALPRDRVGQPGNSDGPAPSLEIGQHTDDGHLAAQDQSHPGAHGWRTRGYPEAGLARCPLGWRWTGGLSIRAAEDRRAEVEVPRQGLDVASIKAPAAGEDLGDGANRDAGLGGDRGLDQMQRLVGDFNGWPWRNGLPV